MIRLAESGRLFQKSGLFELLSAQAGNSQNNICIQTIWERRRRAEQPEESKATERDIGLVGLCQGIAWSPSLSNCWFRYTSLSISLI